MVNDMEAMIRLLQESNEQLKKRVQSLEDTRAIANLMGRYIYFHEAHRDAEFADTIYAQKTPGVSAEVATSGVSLGKESIRNMLSPHSEKKDRKGTLFTHPLTTPVIEVAGDGKTAKGVWIAPGYETDKHPKTGKPLACWCYTKYGCDFVKEDGQWRIWHYHVYRVFMTPFGKPWTEEWERYDREKEFGTFAMGNTPDAPTTYDHPYALDTERELVPAPPEPYETFSETFSYGVPDKK